MFLYGSSYCTTGSIKFGVSLCKAGLRLSWVRLHFANYNYYIIKFTISEYIYPWCLIRRNTLALVYSWFPYTCTTSGPRRTPFSSITSNKNALAWAIAGGCGLNRKLRKNIATQNVLTRKAMLFNTSVQFSITILQIFFFQRLSRIYKNNTLLSSMCAQVGRSQWAELINHNILIYVATSRAYIWWIVYPFSDLRLHYHPRELFPRDTQYFSLARHSAFTASPASITSTV